MAAMHWMQNHEICYIDNNINIELTEQHQAENGFYLIDTTDNNNYSSSEDEEEFHKDITDKINETNVCRNKFRRRKTTHVNGQ